MWSFSHQYVECDEQVVDEARAAKAELISDASVGFCDKEILGQSYKETIECYGSAKLSRFKRVAVIGIGGSSLGSMALVRAVAPELIENRQILFFDNVDTKTFQRRLKQIDNFDSTMWVVISKSGGTIETLATLDYLRQYLQNQHAFDVSKNCVVITETKKSPLYTWAKDNNCPTLSVPVPIGGRYSLLTSVGLLPAMAVGLDHESLMLGAQAALESEFPLRLAAQFIMSLRRHEHMTYFFHYNDDLSDWGQWTQQLWAESLGKRKTVAGDKAPKMSVPLAIRGATDQHSVLQQIAEGTFKKFVVFLKNKELTALGESLTTTCFESSPLVGKTMGELLDAEAVGTSQSLSEAGIASITIETEKIDTRSMGFLFMTMELAVAICGRVFQIDPFDQPGVESSKVISRAILKS